MSNSEHPDRLSANWTDRYAGWTVADLYWKMDSEGGISDLIYWGGPEVFTALGVEAVEAAAAIEIAMDLINRLFDQHSEEIETSEENW